MRKKAHHVAVLIVLLATALLPSASGFAQSDTNGVHLTLTDHQGNPLANVNVTLFLYQLGEGKALAVPMESSRTEEEGRCQLLLPADAPRDQSGFFRGYLVIEDYGNRSLLWPGGVLTVNVWLNAAGRGLDIAGHPPYDWQKPDADPVAVEVLSTPRSQVWKGRGRVGDCWGVARDCALEGKMKRFLLLTAVVLMMAFFITSPVKAANRYDDGTCEVDVCMGWPEAVTAMVTVAVRNMGLGILKTVAGVAWLLDKAALFIFDLVVHGAIWKALRAGLLDSLAAFMPDVLTDLIGGPEGLLYIALLVAGISMTVPSLNSRLVNPGRAILWAAVVMAVFGSGALGYDLIGLVEELRSNTMERIINAGSEGDITSLVTGPMLANEDDILLTNKSLLELPDAFEDFYFLKPQGYLTVRTIFFEGPASYDAVADMGKRTIP